MQLLNISADPASVAELSAGIALSQVQLQQQLQQQTRYQTLIDHLTTVIRNTSDLNEIFELACEGTQTALQVSRCFLLLVKYPAPFVKSPSLDTAAMARVKVVAQHPLVCNLGTWEHPPIATDASPKQIKQAGTWVNHSFQLSDCQFCWQVLADGVQPLVTPELVQPQADLTDSLAISTHRRSPTADTFPSIAPPKAIAPRLSKLTPVAPMLDLDQMPALMLVPLENQGTVLGYLAVQHDQPTPWQLQELVFVKLVAAQISTAMIQSHTLQQVQGLVEERTAQLQRSLDVQAKLYAKTRQQIEQLQQLNLLKDEFLSTMSHELRTPLTTMMLAIRMLRQADLPSDRRQRYLDILEQQCNQETNLINDLLALQQLETDSSAAQMNWLDLPTLIQELQGSLASSFAQQNVSFEVCCQIPKVQTNLDSLQRILTELLTNARKYAIAHSAIQMTVQRCTDADADLATPCIAIAITNRGAGIPPEEMPYIFEKFRRGQGVTQQAIPGTGLGLALVKGLVEHINGAIAVSSQPIDPSATEPTFSNACICQSLWETCFTLYLPLDIP